MTVYSSRQEHLNVFVGWNPSLKKFFIEIKDPFQKENEEQKTILHAYSSDLEELVEKADSYDVRLEPVVLNAVRRDSR